MKRFFGLSVLLSLLVLAACSDTPEVGTAPDDAANVASFQFAIDPGGEQVSVTQLEPEGLGAQQFTQLDPDTQLKLNNARYIFGANNTLTIKATFTNVTSNTNFLQPFSFGPATSPQGGNYLRSSEPTVTDADLGGDGVLSPGETTATLTFTVEHKGQRFSYRVNAYAQLDFPPEGCGADGTFDGYVTITTQADIDALRGCTTITEDFAVYTDAATLDFSPLDDLQTVGGLFTFAAFDPQELPFFPDPRGEYGPEVNPDLTSISGFNNLESVGGFYIINNPSLVSLTGFEKLGGEVGEIVITNNPLLTSVPDFGGVTSIDGNLFLINNDALTAISGFGSLETAATFFEPSFGPFGAFLIGGNASLISVSGFEQLERIGDFYGLHIENNPSLVSLPSFENLGVGSLTVEANDSLTSFAGFGALRYARRLEIIDNPALVSISEFGALEYTRVTIEIRNNDALVSLSGFGKLSRIGTGGIEEGLAINDNSSLVSISGFDSLSSDNIRGGISVISNNPNFDCSVPPQSELPFLPVDESVGNLVNCPTE